MSTDTKGILVGEVSPYEIVAIIKEKYSFESNILDTMFENYKKINFKNETGHIASMSFHSDLSDDNEIYSGKKTSISMANYGENQEVVRSVVQEFGGFFLASDTTEDWEALDGQRSLHMSSGDRLRVQMARILGSQSGAGVEKIIEDPALAAELRNSLTEYLQALENDFASEPPKPF